MEGVARTSWGVTELALSVPNGLGRPAAQELDEGGGGGGQQQQWEAPPKAPKPPPPPPQGPQKAQEAPPLRE